MGRFFIWQGAYIEGAAEIHGKNRVGGIVQSWHIARMSDYDRIARVIRYIDEHQAEQPDLNSLADVAGLSPSHFHRLFSRWAGITPKDFLQSLTLADAKHRLKMGNSVMVSALNAGLSGSSRLHDLCVNLEAATPGEIKAGGAGWVIRAGYAESPFGQCLLAESPRGICHLSFDESFRRLERNWPNAEIVCDDKRAAELVGQVFKPDFQPLEPLRAYVKGSEFQIRVWRALLEIPEGSFMSYGALAERIGKPKASRAVGTAIGRNPIGYLIPCHRVIRETGAVGGYAWGTDRKRAIQAWEATSL